MNMFVVDQQHHEDMDLKIDTMCSDVRHIFISLALEFCIKRIVLNGYLSVFHTFLSLLTSTYDKRDHFYALYSVYSNIIFDLISECNKDHF